MFSKQSQGNPTMQVKFKSYLEFCDYLNLNEYSIYCSGSDISFIQKCCMLTYSVWENMITLGAVCSPACRYRAAYALFSVMYIILLYRDHAYTPAGPMLSLQEIIFGAPGSPPHPHTELCLIGSALLTIYVFWICRGCTILCPHNMLIWRIGIIAGS